MVGGRLRKRLCRLLNRIVKKQRNQLVENAVAGEVVYRAQKSGNTVVSMEFADECGSFLLRNSDTGHKERAIIFLAIVSCSIRIRKFIPPNMSSFSS